MKSPKENSASTNSADIQSAKPPFATGHEQESILEHQGSINYKTNDGFGNASETEGTAAPKGQYETEKKIPPAF